MTEKWTPGPWVKDGLGRLSGSDGTQVGVWDAGIAHVSRDATSESNANLIAAAPELYEALEPLYAIAIDRSAGSPEWDDKDTVQVILSIGDLRRASVALSKARGEA